MMLWNIIISKSAYLWALILNLSLWIYWDVCAKVEEIKHKLKEILSQKSVY